MNNTPDIIDDLQVAINDLANERNALAARLALIERGCAVIDSENRNGAVNTFETIKGGWCRKDEQDNDNIIEVESPTILGLIEKLGGQQ